MPRDTKPQSVKSETVNGDASLSNNGPGSIPPRNPSQGPVLQQSNFSTSQAQNESEVADMFSPVSETSSAAAAVPVSCSSFDDMPPSASSGATAGAGRMSAGTAVTDVPPMSPFSVSAASNINLPRGPVPMMPGTVAVCMPSGTVVGCVPGPHPCPPGMPMGQRLQMMHGTSATMPPGPGAGMQHGGAMLGCMPPHGKVYPPNQPMVFNPANPNAPPIYPCGVCHKEIHDSDQAILCESGCNFWFHRTCTGLTDLAYILLTKEVYAEWVCERCLSSRSIPLVKLKP